jgi:quinol monooxygenase YgiN
MKSDVVTLTIDMRFPPESIDQAIQLLVSGSGRIEAKPGCGESLIARDSVEENRVRYSETWATDAALQRHLQSEEFRRVLFAMDMCCEEPQVAIGNFAGHTGLLYLQQLCDRQKTG